MLLLHFAFKSMPIFLELNDQIVMIGTPTGCPNKFGIGSDMFASEASLTKKFVFRSKKLLFQPFLKTAKTENGFLSNFSPISWNLLNKLIHKIFGKKLPKNSICLFAVHKKGLKSNFMEQNTFFRKIRNLRWQTSELQNIAFSLSQTCWDTLYFLISYLSLSTAQL